MVFLTSTRIMIIKLDYLTL